MALGEDVHPRALYRAGGGQGHRKPPPSCAPGFTQPGFLPTHSQWDLMGGRVGEAGCPEQELRGLLLNSRYLARCGGSPLYQVLPVSQETGDGTGPEDATS